MISTRRTFAAVAGALALAAAAASPAGASVFRLGHAAAVASRGQHVLGSFRLPRGTTQGKPLWYTIRLHAQLRFTGRVGECILSAATNGQTAAQMTVLTDRGGAHISSLGWIQGRRHEHVTGRSKTIDFRNYLRTQGVHGGTNTFSVSLDVLRGRCFDAIRILPDSGVGATRVRPDELQLLVPRTTIVATVGHRTELPFAVTRRGGRPGNGLEVSLDVPQGVVATSGSVHRFGRIGRRGDGAFELLGRKPGRYVLALAVPRQYNQPTAHVEVDVVPPPSWLRTRFLPALVAAAFLAAAVWFTRQSGRRSPAASTR